jgi:hypothetical protein
VTCDKSELGDIAGAGRQPSLQQRYLGEVRNVAIVEGVMDQCHWHVPRSTRLMSVQPSNSFLAAGIYQLEMFGFGPKRGRVTPFLRVGQELLRDLLGLVEDVESKHYSLIPVVSFFP